MKKRTITLMDMQSILGSADYKVVKLQNTVNYEIGEFLSKSAVDGLCKSNHTTVNIIAYKK